MRPASSYLYVPLLCLIVALPGCTARNGSSAAPEPARSEPARAEASPEPSDAEALIALTDSRGQRRTFARAPQRILSLAPSATEILFAIGAGDRLVGRTSACDFPPEAASVPAIGDLLTPDFERLAAAQADVAIMMSGSVPVRDRLERSLNVPVVVIQPETVEEVFKAIQMLGRLTGREVAASQLAAGLKARAQALTAPIQGRPPVTVFYEIWHDPLRAVGPGTYIDDLIQRAGGQNIAADANTPWPLYPLERLIQHNPAVILTGSADRQKAILSGEDGRWATLDAVKRSRVVALKAELISRPGPRMVEGLAQLINALHPAEEGAR